ncbi:MAG TPA: helix-turn-helix domain-containing protein [Pseudoxanthomonas sp.]
MERDYTGVIEENRNMRAFLDRFVRKAPKLADHVESRITVDLKSGERTVEKIAQRVAADAMKDEILKAKVVKRTEEILDQAVEGAARRAAEWRMRDIARRIAAECPPVEGIFAAITEATGKSAGQLVGPRRSRDLTRPRFLTYWLLKTLRPDLSLPAIGKTMNRDHTSCMHGIARFEDLKDEPPYRDWLAHPAIVALLEEGDRK